ncbi:hypothetical protein QFC21_004570 [Naganishia friedmannii]|uniref:Uncharacterized protein n=1 Tax=Naganishia friedmannii TaxID=89922 RepID=A0ACC2VGN9_9TREE|nr:hypothetical protein QFC21_004570 [Naganishia friedmannii]
MTSLSPSNMRTADDVVPEHIQLREAREDFEKDIVRLYQICSRVGARKMIFEEQLKNEDPLAIFINQKVNDDGVFGTRRFPQEVTFENELERSRYLLMHIRIFLNVASFHMEPMKPECERRPEWLLTALQDDIGGRDAVAVWTILNDLSPKWYAVFQAYLREWEIHGADIDVIVLESAGKENSLALSWKEDLPDTRSLHTWNRWSCQATRTVTDHGSTVNTGVFTFESGEATRKDPSRTPGIPIRSIAHNLASVTVMGSSSSADPPETLRSIAPPSTSATNANIGSLLRGAPQP